jgi:hypothetical protein
MKRFARTMRYHGPSKDVSSLTIFGCRFRAAAAPAARRDPPGIFLLILFDVSTYLEAISKIGFSFEISRRKSAGQEREAEDQPAPFVNGIFDTHTKSVPRT